MGVKDIPYVVVVTPIHNGIKHTLVYLSSMQQEGYPRLQVIIIDDGSTDGSAEAIKNQFPNTVVLPGDGSLWWSGATNLGVKYAMENKADYVFTVNNDVVLEPGSIQSLVEVASRRSKALIGSLVCYKTEPAKVWYGGGKFDRKTKDLAHRLGSRHDFTEVKPAEWLAGMGVLVPVKAYEEAGLYDAINFPQYFGDADFSLRTKAKGYELLVNPGSVVLVDDTSSWIYQVFKKGSWSFLVEAFSSIKSQYNLKIRFKFYRRYWPSHWGLAIAGFYIHFLKTMLWPFIKMKFKRHILNLLPFLKTGGRNER